MTMLFIFFGILSANTLFSETETKLTVAHTSISTLGTTAAATQECAPPKIKAQPNILLIVSEDNGPELGCYGDPYLFTEFHLHSAHNVYRS